MAELVIAGYAIDDKLLARKPIRRCRLEACQAACCSDGVWVDHAQAERILAHAALIQPFLPEARRDPSQWFAELHEDPTFPSGRCIGTTTVADPTHPNGSTCIFLRPSDRRCAIQAACLAAGRPAWELKPYYCCLFPLVDEEGDGSGARRLTLDDENDLFRRGGGCYELCAEAQPVFQVYAEETALALGLEGYRQLCHHAGVAPRL
jgi:Fe-S-cluster containining protein